MEANDYQDIDMAMLISDFEMAKQNRKIYTEDFPYLNNIVDAVPLKHDKDSPYVGDTTTAGLVRKAAKSSLQQLPVMGMVVNGSKETITAHTCSYLLRDSVFNEDTFGKGLLSTTQLALRQAITQGYAACMAATGSMFNEFGTSMKLLHYRDVNPEPGNSDGNEASYTFVSTNVTKSKLKSIASKAKEIKGTSWNVPKIEELIEMEPESEAYSLYESDTSPKNNVDSHTYELVVRYVVGRGGARFITFCPQIQDEPLRVTRNKSKFGYPRVQYLVVDPALLHPFGNSRVRMASPNHNLINVYYQNIMSMLLLNSKPPIFQRGRFSTPVTLKQGALWKAMDPNSEAKLMSLDNGALAQFTPFSQQMTSQIQNAMGMTGGTPGGNGGALGFSKTGPGVRQQDKYEDLSVNEITNIAENFLRQYGLAALDTLISEQVIEDEEIPNDDELILDDEAKTAINRVGEQDFEPQIDPVTGQPLNEYVPIVGKDNVLKINWREFYASIKKWSVQIELSVSKDELDDQKRADLQDMLTTILQNNKNGDPELTERAKELMDMLLEKSAPSAKRISPTPGVGNFAPVDPGLAAPQAPPAIN